MVRGPIPRLTTLVLLALVPAACGDDGPSGPGGDLDDGTFEATVSGDLSLTLTGEAFFASVNLGDGFAAWSLTLSPPSGGSQETSIVLTHYGSRPSEGSHTMTLNEQTGEGYQLGLHYWEDGDLLGILLGTSGTLQVTSSSTNRMRGSMQATLQGSITVDGEPQQVTVTVNASFDAYGASL